jgi:hypothetical protein
VFGWVSDIAVSHTSGFRAEAGLFLSGDNCLSQLMRIATCLCSYFVCASYSSAKFITATWQTLTSWYLRKA